MMYRLLSVLQVLKTFLFLHSVKFELIEFLSYSSSSISWVKNFAFSVMELAYTEFEK